MPRCLLTSGQSARRNANSPSPKPQSSSSTSLPSSQMSLTFVSPQLSFLDTLFCNRKADCCWFQRNLHCGWTASWSANRPV
jgi:hypothetical protein